MRQGSEEMALRAFNIASKQNHPTITIQMITRKEKIAIGRRILIAQLILTGKTRMEINNLIGVSPNTFAQINRWLESELKDYTSAHKPTQVSRASTSRYVQPFSYTDMKRRYPAHFSLFSLVEKLWEKK